MQSAWTIFLSVVCPPLQYFTTLSHLRYCYGKNAINKKRVFWFVPHLLSETFLILRRNERDMIKMYIGLHVKYSLFLSFLMKLKFARQFFENKPISNFMKIRPLWSIYIYILIYTPLVNIVGSLLPYIVSYCLSQILILHLFLLFCVTNDTFNANCEF
jgi:hypothetical protein